MENDFKQKVDSANQFTDAWNSNIAFKKKWRGTNPYYVSVYNEQRMAMSELLFPIWDSLEGKKVLDFGCGDGFESYLFLNLGAELNNIIGIDINPNLIDEGKKLNPNFNIMTYDGITIPLADETFDLVACIGVFSSIDDRDHRIRLSSEIKRVMKSDGYIYWVDLKRIVISNQLEDNHPEKLWPGLTIKSKQVTPYPSPGVGLRPLKGMKKWLKPILNKLGYAPTHLAALIGPK